MSLFAYVHEVMSKFSTSRVVKLTPEQKKEVESTIRQFMSEKGFKSPSELMRALKKDPKLKEEFGSAVGAVLSKLGVGDKSIGIAVGAGVLRGMVAEERRNLRILSLVGGNEAFLKNAEAARTLFAEVKAEVGENNTYMFLYKYYTDAGFKKRVDTIIEEKLRDERFSVFQGLKPEEILKGTSAVYVSTMTRSEKAKELLPIVGKESAKALALTLGTTTAGILEQMTLMMTSVTIGQVPGGAQAAWMAYYTARESGGIFASMYSNLMKTASNTTSEQMKITTIEQLLRSIYGTPSTGKAG